MGFHKLGQVHGIVSAAHLHGRKLALSLGGRRRSGGFTVQCFLALACQWQYARLVEKCSGLEIAFPVNNARGLQILDLLSFCRLAYALRLCRKPGRLTGRGFRLKGERRRLGGGFGAPGCRYFPRICFSSLA